VFSFFFLLFESLYDVERKAVPVLFFWSRLELFAELFLGIWSEIIEINAKAFSF